MRVLAVLLLIPVAALAEEIPNKEQALKAFQANLWESGWNCDKANDIAVEEPSYRGDVYKVTCESSSAKGTRTFVYRVTLPKYPGAKPSFLAEPWK